MGFVDEKLCSVEDVYLYILFTFVTVVSTIMFFLQLGLSHLYASGTSKNPGPLDSASVKNEEDTNPRAVSVTVDDDTKVKCMLV